MAIALETVVKQLEDSGIVAPGKLENFVPPKAQPKNADELIAELVKEHHLTKFQAAQVAAGKSKSLILGSYTILDKIGAGGMGQVFKALHRRMDRLVAIKMLPTAMMKDAPAVARFEREVRAAAKLSHPNIVAAHDADQANGVHFLVMEYVEGQDLSALVKKNGPFTVAKATNFILQAARGLEFAHSEGVVHRDIKPANLLLDKKGVVKILDMGLARIESEGNVAAQAELTGTGAIMGTVDYMAPEQGVSTKNADARADIYSLGCTLHYLIIGKATYGGETVMAKMLAHHHQPIPNLRELNGEVPEQVQAVFNKMVAKKIEDRYQTITEVIADLERLGAGQQTSPSIGPSASTNVDLSAMTFLKNIPIQETVQKTKGTKKAIAVAKPNEGKQPPRKNTKVLIGAAFLGVAILAGIIVSLRTKDGTLIVEVDQPDATVQVLDAEGKVEVSQKGGVGKVSISVDPGKHRLKVEKDGFTVFGQEFEMESGGNKAITAKLVPVKVVAVPTQTNMPWNTPAFQAWMKAVAAMPAEEQVKAVSKKMVELNPAFDGKVTGVNGLPTPRIANGVVTEFGFVSDNVTDISPVRAFVELKSLSCRGTSFQTCKMSDLSPLSGMRLTQLECTRMKVSDLSPLQGMPLTKLTLSISAVSDLSPLRGMRLTHLQFVDTPVTDLSPLRGMPLTSMRFDETQVSDVSPLSGMPLTDIHFGDQVSDLTPLKGMPLTSLTCSGPGISDLTPLRGLPLTHVSIAKTPVTDISPLQDCTSLKTLDCRNGKVTPAAVAALQKALPNCKITWDDPAKPTTPQPAAALGPSPPLAKAPFDATQAKAHQQAWAKHLGIEIETPNSVGMKMVLIPPGEFMMGSTDEQVEAALKVAEETKLDEGGVKRIQEERPQHLVRITKPLRLSAHEVTIGQFAKFVEQAKYKTQAEEFGGNSGMVKLEEVKPDSLKLNWRTPGQSVTDDSPVTQVSWNDAVAFCNWLSEQEQLTPCYQRDGDTWMLLPKANGYRLPTEAEWEYACRAGTTTQYWFGDDWKEHDKFGWSIKNAGGRPHSVGSLPANAFGLYDMHGNVWEWCHDWYDGKWYEQSPGDDPLGPSRASSRVSRGGGWDYLPAYGRSSSRNYGPPSYRHYNRGFRPALSSVGAQSSTANVTPQPAVPAKPITDFNSPEFQAWVKEVQAMPAEEQVKAVSKKLMELNPGFDGVVTGVGGQGLPTIVKGVVTELGLGNVTDIVTDISPVRALVGLKSFRYMGSGPGTCKFSDLSPLKGLSLTSLLCEATQVSDLSPLQGMPLTTLAIANSRAVSDLSPLRGMSLTRFTFGGTQVSDLTPLQGMPLTTLSCFGTKVSDLSPLKGMPLTSLLVQATDVSDLSPLESCKSLVRLDAHATKVPVANVEALQKALPNCKITWDDPAKPAAPAPAASGTK